MKPTKKHISDKALNQFNENGVVNVRLQHIADAAFVSVGHLAYHFKNKDGIIDALYDELKTKQEILLAEFRIVPLFEDVNRYLKSIYQLHSAYIFFYLDTLEILRAYPTIQTRHSQHLRWQLMQIKTMLDFNISRGAFIFLTYQQRLQLAWQIRSMVEMWRYMVRIENSENETEENFLNCIWGILKPFFSDMGMVEFKQLI